MMRRCNNKVLLLVAVVVGGLLLCPTSSRTATANDMFVRDERRGGRRGQQRSSFSLSLGDSTSGDCFSACLDHPTGDCRSFSFVPVTDDGRGVCEMAVGFSGDTCGGSRWMDNCPTEETAEAQQVNWMTESSIIQRLNGTFHCSVKHQILLPPSYHSSGCGCVAIRLTYFQTSAPTPYEIKMLMKSLHLWRRLAFPHNAANGGGVPVELRRSDINCRGQAEPLLVTAISVRAFLPPSSNRKTYAAVGGSLLMALRELNFVKSWESVVQLSFQRLAPPCCDLPLTSTAWTRPHSQSSESLELCVPSGSPTLAPRLSQSLEPIRSPAPLLISLSPTSPPSSTLSPTLGPTPSPTPILTSSPTLAPTPSPTLVPTFSPTLQPTPSPTSAATSPPTPAPTPSLSPTLLPAAAVTGPSPPTIPAATIDNLPADLKSPTVLKSAFAFRLLRTSYTGPCVDVVRADGNMSTFYADVAGNLFTSDGITLASWLGLLTGRVSRWYDQSGLDNHATQSSNGSFPFIAPSSAGPGYSLRFNGSEYLTGMSSSMLQATSYTVTVVERRGDSGSYRMFVSSGSSQSQNGILVLGYRSNTSLTHAHYLNDYDMTIAAYATNSKEPVRCLTFTYSNVSGKYTYLNGSLLGSRTDTNGTMALSRYSSTTASLLIGRYSGSYYYVGEIFELEVFTTSFYDYDGMSSINTLNRSQSAFLNQPSPTPVPAPSPTLQPTSSAPVSAATSPPTPAPTPSPTLVPTFSPTLQPTPSPTSASTSPPTMAPTPSLSPTLSPTAAVTGPSPLTIPAATIDNLPADLKSPTVLKSAFAFRLLRMSYTGPCVDVVRADGNISTFYADVAGNLFTSDGITLASWLGLLTGRVSRWYDQSGLDNHATQSSNASFPSIAPASTGPGYSLRFNGVEYLTAMSSSVLQATNYTVTVVERRGDSGGYRMFVSSGSLSTQNGILVLGYKSNTSLTHAHYVNDYNMAVAAYATTSKEPVRCLTFAFSNVSGKYTYLNGSLLGSRTDTNGTMALSQYSSTASLLIGRYTSLYYVGEIFELEVFTTSFFDYDGMASINTVYKSQSAFLN